MDKGTKLMVKKTSIIVLVRFMIVFLPGVGGRRIRTSLWLTLVVLQYCIILYRHATKKDKKTYLYMIINTEPQNL